MSTENIAVTGSEKVRKRKKLTAAEKWQIFLETSAKDAPVGEILRRRGVYSSGKNREKTEKTGSNLHGLLPK